MISLIWWGSDTPEYKRCSDCLNVLALEQFHKNRAKLFGVNNRCKDCQKDRNAARWAKGQELLEHYRLSYKVPNASKSDVAIIAAVDLGLADSMWKKVDKTENCWLWTGGRNGEYGIYSISAQKVPLKTVSVHRLSYALHYGSVPPATVKPTPTSPTVHHTCFNPLCVNPAHLAILSHGENARLRKPCKV